ncbi:MAG: T9SS type A sorting domain-containing protein [Saprospiraceae bacterium]|nr:T9SS type A sorting domain-containing protein [Saprospiraceae bacterium]
MIRNTTLTLFAVILIATLFLSNSGNPNNGLTGGPGEGLCTQCHSGGGFSGNVAITGIPSTVQAGDTYTITVTTTATAGSPVTGGFQLMALNSSNQNAGDLIVVNGGETGTDFQGGREYMEHRGDKGYSGNMVSWEFEWKAPPGPNNTTITFYFSSVLANNNMNSSGDNVVNSNFSTTLEAPVPPTISIANIDHVSCNGGNDGSITASASSGTPPYTFEWSNGDSGPTISGLTAGTYMVTVTDFAGLTASTNAIVNQPAVLSLSIANSEALTCNSPALVSVAGSGGTPGYTFSWSTGGAGDTEALFLNDLPATVTITDNNNCTQELQINSVPVDTVSPTVAIQGGMLTCLNPNLTLGTIGSSSGPCFTYSWTGPNGFSSSDENPLINDPGLYTLVITNTCNGCNASGNTTVTEDINSPSFSITISDTIDCNAPIIEIIGAPGPNYLYSWSTVTGMIEYGTDSIVVGVSKGGSYFLTITNPVNGCTNSGSAIVSEIIDPSISIDSIAHPVCFGDNNGFASLSGNNGMMPYAFLWPDSSVALVRSDLSAGLYVITLTDQNGCQAVDTLTLTQPELIVSNIVKTDESGPGLDDGTASVAPSGGTPGYTVLWSTGDTTLSIIDLEPGTYSVTITDSLECEIVQSTVIQPFGCALTSEAIIVDAPCFGDSGSITLDIQNGNGPISILWSNGDSTLILADVPAGDYSVLITDSVGCAIIDTFTILQPDSILVVLDSIKGQSGPGTKDAAIYVSTFGGSPPYIYKWWDTWGNLVSTLEDLIDVFPGIYTLVIMDSNGCMLTSSYSTGNSSLDAPWISMVNIFPNPAGDFLNLSLPSGIPFRMELLDSRGQLIQRQIGVAENYTLSLQDLSSGIYLIHLQDNNGRSAYFQIIH